MEGSRAAGELHAVTGAFGYSGRYIAHRLLAAGHRVVTLTNTKPDSDPFDGRVRALPLNFEDPSALVGALEGVEVLYNTYWVRFDHTSFTHAGAVENTKRLFQAAGEAGVRRVVHVSITNPSLDSDLAYFSGKAELEQALQRSGLSHAILRPTVLFGREDVLINNIAWMLRTFPVFAIPGDGSYRLQPIFVDDLAELAVRAGGRNSNDLVNAIGPETFTYRKLVTTIGECLGRPRPIVSLPPSVVYWMGAAMGRLLGDVVITRPEIEGLMEERLYVETPPTGLTRLSEWARAHAVELGTQYSSELGRRRTRAA
jgi:NADH dehydrogenase